METIVQFLRPGDAFMARGQRHVIELVSRDGTQREVRISGSRDDGWRFDAVFAWGETVDTLAVML